MRLGVGGERLEQCESDNAAIVPNEIPIVGNVDGFTETSDNQPPAEVLSSLHLDQQAAFII